MLRIDSTNMNYSGSSIINDETIAFFNASINNPGEDVHFSINAGSLTSFQTNLITVKADLESFIDTVIGS